jgi:formate hydrogenlyase subunit 4
MTAWVLLLLHAVLMMAAVPALAWLVGAPAVQGAAHVWRGPAWTLGRDLIRLGRKPSLQPPTASFIFAAVPSFSLGAAAAAALVVPSFSLGMATAPAADLVAVVGLLALSRLAQVLAAYETSAAQSFAANQVAAARLPTEPVLLLAALAMLLMSGGTNLEVAALRDGWPILRVPGLLAGFALLAAVVVEPALPALYSGRALALVMVAAHVRRVAGLSLVMAVGLPFGLAPAGAGLAAWAVGVACWLLKLGLLAGLAALLAPHRILLPAAALLALIAAIILGGQATV